MDMLIVLALGTFKAGVLLGAAAVVVVLLRRQPARLRAVVWSTALAGCVVIPVAAPLIPAVPVPMPFEMGPVAPQATPAGEGLAVVRAHGSVSEVTFEARNLEVPAASMRTHELEWPVVLLMAWAAGAILVIVRDGLGLWRMAHMARRARPVTDRRWLALADQAAARINLKRPFRLLVSDEIEMPATAGFVRPVVVVPSHAEQWLAERREAVLLHELIHVARFDWPFRIVARIALALYWFNPLAWWAERRLELEQELACDEEVLAVGTRASHYAGHLLGIARGALRRPVPSAVGLEMAQRNQLEERIMTMLSRSTHRRTRLTVLIPAALLVAAMVPALAAVYPTEATPSSSGPELKEIMSEMRAAEERLEPFLEKIEAIQVDIEPQLEMIEAIDVDIDEEAMAEIELQMAPYLERISEISQEMEPLHEQIEAMSEKIAEASLHIEDGTLEDVERQISEQLERHLGAMEALHVELEPMLAELEVVHESMEHLHLEMEQIHVNMEPDHEALEKLHASLEPFHEQLGAIHVEMEPFHEEMEGLATRLEEVLRGDVERVLRRCLGTSVGPDAPFDEAAARIVNEAEIEIGDDLVEVNATPGESRRVLTDLFAPHRVGTEGNFNEAIDAASRELSPLKIAVE